MENLLDPAVLCFVLGLAAGLARSDLSLPRALYETLSVYLLLAIGLKGGVELARSAPGEILLPLLGALALGVSVPLVAYFVLRKIGRMKRPDSAAIAAHYGSVSAVTFAIVLEYLRQAGTPFEDYSAVLLVVLEIPAIGVGILLAKRGAAGPAAGWRSIARELFLGKSVFLLLGGLMIGVLARPETIGTVKPLFFDLFKGALALFLLEMGLVASRRLAEVRTVGPFLLGFGILMPILSAAMGIAVSLGVGLSPGGTTVLATLAASASYIAAPAAMRIAVPEANPALYLTASLGITFPFNVILGIPLYDWASRLAHQIGG
ncbi:MAG: sodium-dependent bicarbonate transport family permease [Thermoanaerobaculia bacterium]|nr:sodium-dependent bicarbonate transport family permease [Thermoanaerobaculia bacterium]